MGRESTSGSGGRYDEHWYGDERKIQRLVIRGELAAYLYGLCSCGKTHPKIEYLKSTQERDYHPGDN